MSISRETIFNFLKEHLYEIEHEDWEGLCRTMYIRYAFSPEGVRDIFNAIASAGIYIDENDLERSFIIWVNWMINNYRKDPLHGNNYVKNGNELYLTKMCSHFNYHRNGWSVNKMYEVALKNSSLIDWETSKIFP